MCTVVRLLYLQLCKLMCSAFSIYRDRVGVRVSVQESLRAGGRHSPPTCTVSRFRGHPLIREKLSFVNACWLQPIGKQLPAGGHADALTSTDAHTLEVSGDGGGFQQKRECGRAAERATRRLRCNGNVELQADEAQ